MSTFLLTWNPKKYDFDRFRDFAERVRRGRRVSWSVGRTKRVRKGDRLFLLKQGKEPRGMIGSGRATSNWFVGRHYLPERRKAGDTLHYVGVKFDTLLDPEHDAPLARTDLFRGPLAEMHWDSQQSGIEVPSTLSGEVERLWARHLKKTPLTPTKTERRASGTGGAGLGQSNPMVEKRAVAFVTARLTGLGWRVKSVEQERGRGFDLLCRRRGEIRHVEVKGVSGVTESFPITASEIGAARRDKNWHLAVVTSALSPRRKLSNYTGEEFFRGFALQPLQYMAARKNT